MTRITLLLCCTLAAVSVACGDEDDSFDAEQYDGLYAGTWENAEAGTSGPVTIDISIDEDSGAASLTIDFGGNYLGLGDPPPATLTGTFNDERALVAGTSELFGDYNVTIDADGAIVGLMENLAGGAIPKLTYTGEVTDEVLDADYVVTFADGRTGNSTLRMTRQ